MLIRIGIEVVAYIVKIVPGTSMTLGNHPHIGISILVYVTGNRSGKMIDTCNHIGRPVIVVPGWRSRLEIEIVRIVTILAMLGEIDELGIENAGLIKVSQNTLATQSAAPGPDNQARAAPIDP